MIYIYRYELYRNVAANAQTTNAVQIGCLVKYVDSEFNYGVADLCPWPSLGDLTLEQELSQKGPLFQRALELAKTDLAARKNKIKLISDATIKNHQLIQDYKTAPAIDSEIVKIKGDKNIYEFSLYLNNLEDVVIRLDFNFCLTEADFTNFLNLLTPATIKKIDVVEDPFPFNKNAWMQLNQKVKLAIDWNSQSHEWPNLICKPTRKLEDQFLYMTSSMDHPVGIAHGLVFAQKHPEKIHGFLTLDSYTKTDFHAAFLQNKNLLSYQTDGYGIGFEKLFSEISWQPLIEWSDESENQLLVNTNSNDLTVFSELSKSFNDQITTKGYFLIASSGSSRSVDESIKLIALKKSAVLNSAKRVNEQFQLTQNMNWGCVLPTFHVGGLGILARAQLTAAKVFYNSWKTLMSTDFLNWILNNNIQCISLVPAQIYDLVQKNVHCPESLKYVFVGGSELSRPLLQAANKLNWSIIETFGMTETASMFAFRENNNQDFNILSGVSITGSAITCNSLASCSIQKIKTEIKIIEFQNEIKISDQIEVSGHQLKFMGRSDDKIQILSETVSMQELRSKLEIILIQNNLPLTCCALVAISDDRKENLINLFSEVQVEKIVIEFNNIVKPYEKISVARRVDKIPLTDLGKIKYKELIKL